MPIVTLTDISVRTLKPVAGKQVTYIDRHLKGFGVRISEKGAMSWVLVYGPRRQRVKLGDVGIVSLKDARKAARDLLSQHQLGIEPERETEHTFDAVRDQFLDDAATRLRARTVRDYTRLLTRHFPFGKRPLADIKPPDLRAKLDALRSTPSEHFHAQAALATFYRWAFKKHYIDVNPCERLTTPKKRQSRARVLTDDEIKAIWRAGEGMFGDIVKLCLLTGQRRSEIAGLRWEWIDLERKTITFPDWFTKNKREHCFPIGNLTKTVVEAQPRQTDNPYVFPARKDWKKGRAATVYHAWNKDKAALDTACGVTGWVLHDCRRTLVSRWAALGVRIEVTEKYVNHVSGTTSGVTGIYLRHSFMAEQTAAVELWERHLQTLIAR